MPLFEGGDFIKLSEKIKDRFGAVIWFCYWGVAILLPCICLFYFIHSKYTERLNKEYSAGEKAAWEKYQNEYGKEIENSYQSGYDWGYTNGYVEFSDSHALDNFYSIGYEDGYDDGSEDCWSEGYDEGYMSAISDIEEYNENKTLFTQSAIESLLNYLDKQRD